MFHIRSFAAFFGAAALLLAGCSTQSSSPSSSSDSATASSGSAESVTITHAFGTTTITGKPQRIATVAWGNAEVPLALGVVPVGMAKATWGDDDGDGILPWVKERISKLGGDTPVLFDETDGLPFEQIADTHPDVILAAYSGLSKEDYSQLSKIAPTVVYKSVPWGADYKEMIEMDSTGMGRPDDGKQLITKLDTLVHDEFAYPAWRTSAPEPHHVDASAATPLRLSRCSTTLALDFLSLSNRSAPNLLPTPAQPAAPAFFHNC
ncbi:MAG: ABC transporter substrate-binding protein [Actinomycetaceae bacterium]|nr:ABC transporter substrate-binding protein [Actinomycetaceae bacterium]MDY6083397.1 ABC transporter substrate-binding protein [Actinomycetaceae bacterium]